MIAPLATPAAANKGCARSIATIPKVKAAPATIAGASQRPIPLNGAASIRGSSWCSTQLSILPDAHAIRRGKIQLLSGLSLKARIPWVHVADDIGPLLGG